MKIWRVNTKSKTSLIEDIPQSWASLGGRGLSAKILLDEVDPECDPLGPKNKLIFAPGLLTGHRLSSLDRISIGGKSPLTGGIKESNAGGRTGYELTKLGIKALILEDRPEDADWGVIHISKDGVRFDSAKSFLGQGVYKAASGLIEKYGGDVAIALIGPGGEMKMMSSGIQNIDKDKVPSRIAARGGLGAVMGSKFIKAIVIDTAGEDSPPIQDLDAFKQARKKYTSAVLAHPQTTTYADYGTSAMVSLCDGIGAMPTRNFSSGIFEDAEKISGDRLREMLLERGGVSDTTHACMAGCIIKCSNTVGDIDGETVLVSPLDYETIGLMGSNLGINDLDKIAKLNQAANDIGIDTIEIGAALGVAADAGLMDFGDGERAFDLLQEIREGTPLGRILGNGAAFTGKAFGVERVPVAKGQAMPAYDPRAIKGTGVTYATSPQGADHTCGLTIRAKVKPTDPNGQVEVSRNAQINMAGYDSLGACIMAGFGIGVDYSIVGELINSIHGFEVGDDFLQELGKETLLLEREFNKRAGFTKQDDRLPEWMSREPLPPHNVVFDVSKEDLDSVFET
ncbi:MAG: aldehyde ferredoxin oxidoreductase [Anaerolineales bacterium]|uniref:Aldehyde ferredoxin oxidoreductase n=1 Tax=Candidatus Desulfolinea nitratireducens TaxID=2841698 RepID=A0A8J6TEX2_9CHLR|nr:aldehyde ferredoxin oxidoreductase [Candidatus Desulfolinea nitratireducens]MBL6960085.1 aldehyde ferredoxin oxidoreductase [Anaerolineales bacterium]